MISSNTFQSFPIISPTFNIPNIHLIASASTNGNSLNYLLSTDKKRSWNKWSRREGLTLTQAGHKEGFRSYTSLQWVEIFLKEQIGIMRFHKFLFNAPAFLHKFYVIAAISFNLILCTSISLLYFWNIPAVKAG